MVVVSSLVLCACDMFNRERINYIREVESKLPGVYIINPAISVMNPYNSGYANLKLVLTKDHQFHLSKRVPFMTDSFGTWKYVFENEVAYVELEFNKGMIKEQLLRDSNLLIFKTPQPIYGKPPVKEVIFERQVDSTGKY